MDLALCACRLSKLLEDSKPIPNLYVFSFTYGITSDSGLARYELLLMSKFSGVGAKFL